MKALVAADVQVQTALTELAQWQAEEVAQMERMYELWSLEAPQILQVKARGLEEARRALTLPMTGYTKALLADWVRVQSGEYGTKYPRSTQPITVPTWEPLDKVYAVLADARAEELKVDARQKVLFEAVKAPCLVLTLKGVEFTWFAQRECTLPEPGKWFLHDWRQNEKTLKELAPDVRN